MSVAPEVKRGALTAAARWSRSGPPSMPCDPVATNRAKPRQQTPQWRRRSEPVNRDAVWQPLSYAWFALKPPFRGLVMVLQRDQQALHGAQRPQRGEKDQRSP